MKKMFATMLALSMCLSLAACGPKGSASTSGSSAGTSGSSASGSQAAASDVDYVKEKGTLVVGMTDFAPMDYKAEGSDEWIGFDADMAKAFAESLGVEVEFLEINWDNKALELENKGVDAVWNGMTLTDDVKALMATSEPYCLNGQVVVLAADVADQYQTVESLSGLSFAVENGSAGMEQAEAAGLDYVAMDIKNSPERYGETAGRPGLDLAPFRESVSFLLSGAVDYEFRTTVVRELHDGDSFRAIGPWLSGARRYYLQSFVDRDTVLRAGLHPWDRESLEAFAGLVRPWVERVELRGV